MISASSANHGNCEKIMPVVSVVPVHPKSPRHRPDWLVIRSRPVCFGFP